MFFLGKPVEDTVEQDFFFCASWKVLVVGGEGNLVLEMLTDNVNWASSTCWIWILLMLAQNRRGK